MENKKCVKYKEMIMEKADGQADSGILDIVSKHTGVCPKCAEYENSLKKMMNLTSLMKVEAPDYLETRIMASIGGTTPKFNWFPVLSYGSTFAVALIAVFFLLYSNKPGAPLQNMAKAKPAVIVQQLAAVPVIKTARVAVVKKVIAIKSELVEKQVVVAQAVVVSPVQAVSPAVSAAVLSTVDIAENNSPGKGPARDNSKSPAQVAYVPAASNSSNYGVSSVQSNTGMNVLETGVKPLPTTSVLPLLEQNKAIVANNLINPNHGDAARIVIKVEENSLVKIVIYDKTGRVVSKILNEEKTPGNYDAYWYGKNDAEQTVSAGVYFVFIQIGRQVIKNNIIVNKD